VRKVFFILLSALLLGCSPSEAQIQDAIDKTQVAQSTNTPTPKPTATNTKTETQAPTPTLEPTSTQKPSSTTEPTATQNPYSIKTGTFIVGTDIESGIYYGTAGDDLFDSCYWARLNDLSGEMDAIIANDNAIGQYYVEVKDTDYALKTNCLLTKIEGVPEPTEFKTELQVGTYIVGRDIEPGLYKGQAGEDIMDSCYWARLSDVSGGMGSIIANDNATGQFFIQVASSDFALKVNCPVTLQEE